MDPLSIAAGIAGLATFGTQLATKVYQFFDGIKDAPPDVRQTAQDLDGVASVLQQLKSALRIEAAGHVTFPPETRRDLKEVVKGCEAVFRRLEKLMYKYEDVDTSLRKRAKWNRVGEAEAKKLSGMLTAQKLTLNLTLQLVNNLMTSSIAQGVKSTQADTRLIIQEMQKLRLELTSKPTLPTDPDFTLSRWLNSASSYAGSTLGDSDDEDLENSSTLGTKYSGSRYSESRRSESPDRLDKVDESDSGGSSGSYSSSQWSDESTPRARPVSEVALSQPEPMTPLSPPDEEQEVQTRMDPLPPEQTQSASTTSTSGTSDSKPVERVPSASAPAMNAGPVQPHVQATQVKKTPSQTSNDSHLPTLASDAHKKPTVITHTPQLKSDSHSIEMDCLDVEHRIEFPQAIPLAYVQPYVEDEDVSLAREEIYGGNHPITTPSAEPSSGTRSNVTHESSSEEGTLWEPDENTTYADSSLEPPSEVRIPVDYSKAPKIAPFVPKYAHDVFNDFMKKKEWKPINLWPKTRPEWHSVSDWGSKQDSGQDSGLSGESDWASSESGLYSDWERDERIHVEDDTENTLIRLPTLWPTPDVEETVDVTENPVFAAFRPRNPLEVFDNFLSQEELSDDESSEYVSVCTSVASRWSEASIEDESSRRGPYSREVPQVRLAQTTRKTRIPHSIRTLPGERMLGRKLNYTDPETILKWMDFVQLKPVESQTYAPRRPQCEPATEVSPLFRRELELPAGVDWASIADFNYQGWSDIPLSDSRRTKSNSAVRGTRDT